MQDNPQQDIGVQVPAYMIYSAAWALFQTRIVGAAHFSSLQWIEQQRQLCVDDAVAIATLVTDRLGAATSTGAGIQQQPQHTGARR